MKERPIPFTAPMVRAILAGTKTQTRRLVRECPDPTRWHWEESGASLSDWRPECFEDQSWHFATTCHSPVLIGRCPYGVPGDRLWVRESGWSWFEDYYPDEFDDCQDRAEMFRWTASPRQGKRRWLTGERAGRVEDITFLDESTPLEHAPKGQPRPSIHMPRWASRITLELTDVRVQRLQEISEEDALAEGIPPTWGTDGLCWDRDHQHVDLRELYRCLWNRINSKRAPWISNPWVWALSFRRVLP